MGRQPGAAGVLKRALSALVARYLSRLRFPRLFALTAVLFGADLVLPDVIPFADEILLGLGTALFGSWKRTREERRPSGSSSDSTPAP